MYNNLGLVDHCKAWLKYPTRYGWGCWGQPASDSIITAKARQYPGHYDRSRQTELRRLIGKAWLIDCVGLIKNYYWGMTPGGTKVNYIAKTDVSADDMYYRARIKGPISNMPDVPGLCVQLPGHIGVYIGGGQVIESTRGVFGDGVVITKLKDRRWIHWLQCPFIEYVKEEEELIYKTIADVPDWGRPLVQKLIDRKSLAGDGKGNINLPESTLKTLAILEREGIIK